MKKLTHGDIRQKGDEVRSLEPPVNDSRHNPKMNPELDQTKWHKTKLIGFPILKSDLSHLEFRRP